MQLRAHLSAGANVDAEILKHFVSGCGGTGKSFIIKTIRACWGTGNNREGVIVAAPTGIAACNVNGLTIHGMLMLPIEHESTPAYRPLSNDVLKIV